jgi:hypothetical protein
MAFIYAMVGDVQVRLAAPHAWARRIDRRKIPWLSAYDMMRSTTQPVGQDADG